MNEPNDAEQIALMTDDGHPQGDKFRQPAILEFARIAHQKADFFDFVAQTFYSQKCALCRTVQGLALVTGTCLMFWAAHGIMAGASAAAFWLVLFVAWRAAVAAIHMRTQREAAAVDSVAKVQADALRQAAEAIRDGVGQAREQNAAAELGKPITGRPMVSAQQTAAGTSDGVARVLNPGQRAPDLNAARLALADAQAQAIQRRNDLAEGRPDPGVEVSDDNAGLPAAASVAAPARTTTKTTATVTVVGNRPVLNQADGAAPQQRQTRIDSPNRGPSVEVTTAEASPNISAMRAAAERNQNENGAE